MTIKELIAKAEGLIEKHEHIQKFYAHHGDVGKAAEETGVIKTYRQVIEDLKEITEGTNN